MWSPERHYTIPTPYITARLCAAYGHHRTPNVAARIDTRTVANARPGPRWDAVSCFRNSTKADGKRMESGQISVPALVARNAENPGKTWVFCS